MLFMVLLQKKKASWSFLGYTLVPSQCHPSLICTRTKFGKKTSQFFPRPRDDLHPIRKGTIRGRIWQSLPEFTRDQAFFFWKKERLMIAGIPEYSVQTVSCLFLFLVSDANTRIQKNTRIQEECEKSRCRKKEKGNDSSPLTSFPSRFQSRRGFRNKTDRLLVV